MAVQLDYPWAVCLIALVLYGDLFFFFAWQRRWHDTLDRRLLLYIGLAAFSDLMLLGSYGKALLGDLSVLFFHFHVYAQAALPIFFYAFARAFIRKERRPFGFIGGAFLMLILIGIDVTNLPLDLLSVSISAETLVSFVGVILWLVFNLFVALFGLREYRRMHSPMHRNRLSYLALAAPFLFADGALGILIGRPAASVAVTLQMVGMAVIAYVTFQHALVDLRTLLRQVIYLVITTAFALLVYSFAIGLALFVWRGADPSQIFIGAILVAVALTLIYQPLRDWSAHKIQTLIFNQQYDAQRVVQDFSQRLSARIDLDELAREGGLLLEKAMGARAVTLVLVSRSAQVYMLRPTPVPPGALAEIHLDVQSSFALALARATPVLQYDLDRLPRYADVPIETRAALHQLRGEVYVPIVSSGALIGAWVVGPCVSGDPYNDADLVLLGTLADQSAVALENARLLADLREQMAQMRAMRDYLDSTMASIATGVLTLNYENKIISFNRAAEEIFHVPAAKALGKVYDQVLPPFEGVQLRTLLSRVWTHNSQHSVRDVTTQVAGRGAVHLTLQLSAMRRDNETVGVAMVIEDLTEQARLEMQRRAQEQETQRVRATFEHYVTPTVVEGLLADPRRVTLGGERQVVTVMFADIHGFTALSEQLPPEELVTILNGYLALAAKTILKYEGTLDKFLGDGAMAIFNAPMPQPDHAWRAACAALALQREVAAYAPKLPSSQRLFFRIGVHTGEAIVGNIGTRELMNYTAVGDTVNVAKRLQENAEDNQILISRSVFGLIEPRVVARPMEMLVVKGRATPVELFELLGGRK